MKLALIALLLLVLALVLYVNFAPTREADWHVAPDDAPDPGDGGVKGSETFDAAPDRVFAAIEAVAADWPKARLIAGSAEEGILTYEVRSRVIGFPDYVTLKVSGDRAGSKLDYVSRLRFGRSDLGVNRQRMEAWLGAVRARLNG